jgi:hypothetical protein
VFTLDYLLGMARPGPTNAAPDAKIFLDLSARLKRLPFARLWSPEEVAWEMNRYGSVAQVLGSGLITGYVLKDTKGNPCAQIENVFWDDLDADHRLELLKCFLASVSQYAQVAALPLWNYADPEVFRKAGFRRLARRLNVYLALWNGDVPEPMDAMYIDVL